MVTHILRAWMYTGTVRYSFSQSIALIAHSRSSSIGQSSVSLTRMVRERLYLGVSVCAILAVLGGTVASMNNRRTVPASP